MTEPKDKDREADRAPRKEEPQHTSDLDAASQSPSARKDPDEWVTGGESMTDSAVTFALPSRHGPTNGAARWPSAAHR